MEALVDPNGIDVQQHLTQLVVRIINFGSPFFWKNPD